MQRQLQEARAADGVLDDAQAAFRREGRRPCVVGEEHNVVVGRIEIRMIEEVVCVEVEAQPVTLASIWNVLPMVMSKRTWNGARNMLRPVYP